MIKDGKTQRGFGKTDLILYRQDTVGVLCELSHGQDAVVWRGDDVILRRRVDGGDNSTHLGELLLQQAQHSGPQSRARSSNPQLMHLLCALTQYL